jgi:hypothetical protein
MPHEHSEYLQKNRENIISRAHFLGFGKADLIDTHQTLTVQAAKLFARACGPHDQETLPHISRHIIPLLLYTGNTVTEEIEDAIIAIADLPGLVDTDDLKTLIKLIDLHADFTHSVPEGYTVITWKEYLHNIYVNMDKGIDLVVSGKKLEGDDLLRDATTRLARVIGHMWS